MAERDLTRTDFVELAGTVGAIMSHFRVICRVTLSYEYSAHLLAFADRTPNCTIAASCQRPWQFEAPRYRNLLFLLKRNSTA